MPPIVLDSFQSDTGRSQRPVNAFVAFRLQSQRRESIMSDTFQMIQVDLAPDSDAHSRDRLTLHAKEPSVSLREALQAQIHQASLCLFSLASFHALAPARRWQMVGTTMSAARCVAVLAAVLAVAHAGRARVGPSAKHCSNSFISSCIFQLSSGQLGARTEGSWQEVKCQGPSC